VNRDQWLRFLGLGPNSNLPDIKKAWKRRAKETHPDIGGSQDEFIAVTHAYKMLTDDNYQRNQANARTERKQQDLNINMKIHIEWKDAFFGRSITVSWNVVEMGPEENSQPLKTEGEQKLNIETLVVPPGYMGGTHSAAGKGLKKGSLIGDCIMQVLVLDDQRYRFIDNMDISCEQPVPLDLLLRGGKIDVATPWGPRSMTVKPGTMPGSKICIKKSGVGKEGSLHVTVTPKFPGEAELKSEAYKGMKIEWDIKDENDADNLSPEEAEILKQFTDFHKGNKP
jgi:DnaJ-class molecular chaperone